MGLFFQVFNHVVHVSGSFFFGEAVFGGLEHFLPTGKLGFGGFLFHGVDNHDGKLFARHVLHFALASGQEFCLVAGEGCLGDVHFGEEGFAVGEVQCRDVLLQLVEGLGSGFFVASHDDHHQFIVEEGGDVAVYFLGTEGSDELLAVCQKVVGNLRTLRSQFIVGEKEPIVFGHFLLVGKALVKLFCHFACIGVIYPKERLRILGKECLVAVAFVVFGVHHAEGFVFVESHLHAFRPRVCGAGCRRG